MKGLKSIGATPAWGPKVTRTCMDKVAKGSQKKAFWVFLTKLQVT